MKNNKPTVFKLTDNGFDSTISRNELAILLRKYRGTENLKVGKFDHRPIFTTVGRHYRIFHNNEHSLYEVNYK